MYGFHQNSLGELPIYVLISLKSVVRTGAMADYMKYPKNAINHKVFIALVISACTPVCAHYYLFQVPKSIPPWKAAFIEPLACSIHSVELGNIQFNDVVVVSGCGPLGLGMVAAAKLKNPKLLIALDLFEWKVITCQ